MQLLCVMVGIVVKQFHRMCMCDMDTVDAMALCCLVSFVRSDLFCMMYVFHFPCLFLCLSLSFSPLSFARLNGPVKGNIQKRYILIYMSITNTTFLFQGNMVHAFCSMLRYTSLIIADLLK